MSRKADVAGAIAEMYRYKFSPQYIVAALARIEAGCPRKPIPRAWRERAWEKYFGLCCNCFVALTRHDRQLPTHFHCDHVRPIAVGGAHEEANILPLCRTCNLSKGSQTLFQWYDSRGSACS